MTALFRLWDWLKNLTLITITKKIVLASTLAKFFLEFYNQCYSQFFKPGARPGYQVTH
jgi:hypothetical protein